MPRIDWVEEAAATGETAELYAAWRKANPSRDRVPDILKCFGPRSDVLRHMLDFSYQLHFHDGALTWATKELLGTYVSAVNRCEYCVSLHARFLALKDSREGVVAAVRCGDLDRAEITPAERALLEFGGKLARESHAITDADVARLRKVGWTDAQIAEAVYDVGMFALFNRVANAFGLTAVDLQITARPDFGTDSASPTA